MEAGIYTVQGVQGGVLKVKERGGGVGGVFTKLPFTALNRDLE